MICGGWLSRKTARSSTLSDLIETQVAREMVKELAPIEAIVAYLLFEGKTTDEVGELMLKSRSWVKKERLKIRVKWRS